jgi:uncharacterized protein YcbK (DUF882 family)
LSKGPSPNLSWKELACKDGTPYPNAFIEDGTAEFLAFTFEMIRALYNKPIQVVSAYRSPEWNRLVGGARKSQHMYGKALDLKPPAGISVKRFYNDIKERAQTFYIGGIGLYPTFVHIDIRWTGKLVCWKGYGVKDNV